MSSTKKFNPLLADKITQDVVSADKTVTNAINDMKDKISSLNTENEQLKKKLEEVPVVVNPINEENLPAVLNEIETQIDTLKQDTQKCIWLIGQRLKKIRDSELYKPDFADFHEYCLKRFEFNWRTAYNYIYVSDNYTFLQALAIGSKLFLLQRIKDYGERQKIIEWIEKDHPTHREVEQKVKELTTKSVAPIEKPNVKKRGDRITISKISPELQDKIMKAISEILNSNQASHLS